MMPRPREERRPPVNWIDRAIGYIDPQRQLNRMRARVIIDAFASGHFDAAGVSRRTHGWKRPGGDPNAFSGLSLSRLRDSSRQLVRNNGYAERALGVIEDHTVGDGIRAGTEYEPWREWTESTAIDADGRCDLPGLEQMVMRTVGESGEAIIRRRNRRLSDGLPIPLQLQILEPDFIDSSKHMSLPGGGKIVRGVEFSPIGKRVAYWMYREHPGNTTMAGRQTILGESVRVPASEILHIYRHRRPGQVRDVPWFTPVLMRFYDFDEYTDGTIMSRKVAALLCAFKTNPDGTTRNIGGTDSDNPEYDLLQPAMIGTLGPGEDIKFTSPPQSRDYPDYTSVTLHEIAAGIGVTYESMTGDYEEMSFSAARLARLEHYGRVSGWRWRMLVPQMLDPIWSWAVQANRIAGRNDMPETTGWTAPGLPMTDPEKEGLAAMRNIRAGITTLSETLRERGWTFEQWLAIYQRDMEQVREAGITIDSDASVMTQAGQLHSSNAGSTEAEMAELASVLAKLPPEHVAAMLKDAGSNGARR